MANLERNRNPVHVGSRLTEKDTELARCVVAVPIIRGEKVTSIGYDLMQLSKDEADANWDQPPIFSWIAGFAPYTFGHSSGALTPAELDTMVTELDHEAAGYLGGESSLTTSNFLGAEFNSPKVIFRRDVIGTPTAVGKDLLDNTDARFSDHARGSIKTGFEASCSGMLLFGSRVYRNDAETTFGVQDMDASAANNTLAAAYFDPYDADNTNADNVMEVLYGGDNYIEADSFKEVARRAYAIVRPHITKARR